jgi:hypothetical protein
MVISIKDKFIWEFLVTNINVFDNCKLPFYILGISSMALMVGGRVYMYRVFSDWF